MPIAKESKELKMEEEHGIAFICMKRGDRGKLNRLHMRDGRLAILMEVR
jgi:hypothetical protein